MVFTTSTTTLELSTSTGIDSRTFSRSMLSMVFLLFLNTYLFVAIVLGSPMIDLHTPYAIQSMGTEQSEVPNNQYQSPRLGFSSMLGLLYGMLTLFCRVVLFIPWPKEINECHYSGYNFLSNYYKYFQVIIMYGSIDDFLLLFSRLGCTPHKGYRIFI